MEVADAIDVIVDRLRENPDRYASFGYGVYLPTIWWEYGRERNNIPPNAFPEAERQRISEDLSPVFYMAAWELCRRGILRPGVTASRQQSTDAGQAGDGYSLTERGRGFLAAVVPEQFIPIEPNRTAQMLGRFRQRFGDGYHQRSQEATACYGALAYLGCCAMCGAAAESILLAVAIAKSGDEDQTLRRYRAAQGRRNLVNDVVGQSRLGDRFRSFMDLLNYWRDETAHGQASAIGEIEAFDALGRLLRFAHLVDEEWDNLTI